MLFNALSLSVLLEAEKQPLRSTLPLRSVSATLNWMRYIGTRNGCLHQLKYFANGCASVFNLRLDGSLTEITAERVTLLGRLQILFFGWTIPYPAFYGSYGGERGSASACAKYCGMAIVRRSTANFLTEIHSFAMLYTIIGGSRSSIIRSLPTQPMHTPNVFDSHAQQQQLCGCTNNPKNRTKRK